MMSFSTFNSFKRAITAWCSLALLLNKNVAAMFRHPPSTCNPYLHRHHAKQILWQKTLQSSFHSSTNLGAAPKRGSVVESYQTVSVNCNSCRQRLFRYKKKNGTKSNLIKCYVERIVQAEDEKLQENINNFSELADDFVWCCPNCGVNFARCAMIRGLPALKLVGGKTRMTKK